MKESVAPHCCAAADRLGDHSLSCTIGVEQFKWQNHLCITLYIMVVKVGLAPQKEHNGLLPRLEDCPADIFLPARSNGKGTCMNPLQAATVAR